MTEAGLPVTIIDMREARELIWRDDHQIVVPARTVTARGFAERG